MSKAGKFGSRRQKLSDQTKRCKDPDSPLQVCVICEIRGYYFFFAFLYPKNLPPKHLERMLGAHPLEGGSIRWKEFLFHHGGRAATR
jgi:hypothetical protein